jgi:hypothetical protein
MKFAGYDVSSYQDYFEYEHISKMNNTYKNLFETNSTSNSFFRFFFYIFFISYTIFYFYYFINFFIDLNFYNLRFGHNFFKADIEKFIADNIKNNPRFDFDNAHRANINFIRYRGIGEEKQFKEDYKNYLLDRDLKSNKLIKYSVIFLSFTAIINIDI